MNPVRLRAQNLNTWIRRILDTGDRVTGPVRAGSDTLFGAISDPAQLVLGEGLTVKSAKGVFFPQSEVILRFKREDGAIRVEDVEGFAPPTVLLGARPCDAAGMEVLDAVFQWDYRDQFFLQRREQTTIVSFGCSAPVDDKCFCTSVGLAPDSRFGADVFMRPMDAGDYYLEPVTEKGGRLLARTPDLFESTDPIPPIPAPASVVPLRFELDRVKPWLDDHFNDSFWKEMSLRCVGCGTCTFLCPTCHCFDIVDETCEGEGVRCKNWDSCQLSLFTVHASGHNPREKQSARYRQRIMHKFKYYKEKFGMTLCVGCGRCVRACPAGHSILDYLTEIDRRAAANGVPAAHAER